jgi:hypothetical protein
MKLPEWFYCKPHTCILTTYWEESPSKYSPWAAMHLAQWCCHCWKHFWNSCCEITFSAIVTFYSGVFSILKSSSLYDRLYFWEQPETFGAKSGEQSGCSISVHEFWPETIWQRVPCELEYCHGKESNRWAVHIFFYTQLHITTSVFLHNKLGWLFGLV